MGVIYQIVVAGGSRTYIGSARDLGYRRRAHLHLLRKGTHHCRALQNAVTKYGIDAISWTILEDDIAESMLIEREQVWLDQHKGRLYNKSPTAASRLGATMSPEARAKISASLKGNQYRKGKPFSDADKAKIGAGVRRAIAEGRKKIAIRPENLSAYNASVKAGHVVHPSKKTERDKQILARYREVGSLKLVAPEFNLTPSAIGYAIKRAAQQEK